jgi:hypothetical protein
MSFAARSKYMERIGCSRHPLSLRRQRASQIIDISSRSSARSPCMWVPHRVIQRCAPASSPQRMPPVVSLCATKSWIRSETTRQHSASLQREMKRLTLTLASTHVAIGCPTLTPPRTSIRLRMASASQRPLGGNSIQYSHPPRDSSPFGHGLCSPQEDDEQGGDPNMPRL